MIYVVTSGTYSDYGIKAVFTDKARAEKYVEAHNSGDHVWDKASIEEYEDGAEVDDYLWEGRMVVGDVEKSGSVQIEFVWYEYGDQRANIVRTWERKENTGTYGKPESYRNVDVTCYAVFVRNETAEGARKAAAEMINRYRAEKGTK